MTNVAVSRAAIILILHPVKKIESLYHGKVQELQPIFLGEEWVGKLSEKPSENRDVQQPKASHQPEHNRELRESIEDKMEEKSAYPKPLVRCFSVVFREISDQDIIILRPF